MIVPPTNVLVMIATKPVDFRKGVLGLAAAQLSALLEGLEWTRVHANRVARPTATQ